MLSEKQVKIMAYLRQHKTMTLDDAVDLIGYGIYTNRRKYVGTTLTRLVKRNYIVRVKPGTYELPTMENTKPKIDDMFSG